MLQVLLPLHEKMEREGPSTLKEIAFVQVSEGKWGCELGGADGGAELLSSFLLKLKVSLTHSLTHTLPLFLLHRLLPLSLFFQTYGRELSEAYEWIQKFKVSRKEAELHQAWDLYYHVFKRINKQLHSLTTLELQYVAPALVRGVLGAL
jgi:hypothetical protein